MSTAKKTAPVFESPLVLCERTESIFLLKLQDLILQGYRLNLNAELAFFPSCLIATLEHPNVAL